MPQVVHIKICVLCQHTELLPVLSEQTSSQGSISLCSDTLWSKCKCKQSLPTQCDPESLSICMCV